jgi:uncharacterized membrane protein YhdT
MHAMSYLTAASLLAAAPASSQTPSQVQYLYDAAGNLVSATRSAVQLPDLTVSNLAVGVISVNADHSFNVPVTFQVNNTGSGPANATWYDRGYLSANSTLHDTDQALGGFNACTIYLAAGDHYPVSAVLTTSITTAAGNYTLIIKTDGGAGTGPYSPTGANNVVESNEANNTQFLAINLPANPKPDLTVSNASVGAISVAQNGVYSLPVTYTVTNGGQASAAPSWFDLVYLSANATLDDSDQNLAGYNTHSAALAAGASYTATKTYSTSASTAPGTYTLFVKADGRGSAVGTGTNTDNGAVAEGNEANNTQALALTLPAKPDLTVSNVSVGAISVTQAGAYYIPVTYTVTNLGGLSATPNWFDLAYLSTDAVLDNADQNLGTYSLHNTALAPGAGYTVTTTYTSTATTAPGTYTLFMKADGHGTAIGSGTNTDNGAVAEVNETNNVQGLTLVLPSKPDLAVSNVSVGTISISQTGAYSIPLTYTVTNLGGVSAPPNWFDLAYLSTDAVLDNADQNLGTYSLHNTALAPGASYTATTTYITTTATAAGTYTLFMKADGHGTAIGSGTNTDGGAVAEGNEVNNVRGLTLVLPAKPDLAISNVSVGTIVKNANGSKSIPVTYTVTNLGGMSAPPNWFDLAYLSTDAVLDNADQNLGTYSLHNTALVPGASYTATTIYITTTATAPGTYTLFMKTDGHGTAIGSGTNTDIGAVAESNEANNVVALPVVLP